MKRLAHIAAGTVLAAGIALGPATAAFADKVVCDSYSGKCTTVPDTVVQGEKLTKPPTQVEGNRLTLPFTGGEIVLMTAAGTATLGAGIVLVVAGRRRRTGTRSV